MADAAVLIAAGVRTDGLRTVLWVSVLLLEAEVRWRRFLASLTKRGLCGVRFITSDDHEGLRAARQAVFAGIPWQRCQTHLQRNAPKYIPKVAMRPAVAHELRGIFNADSCEEADCKLAAFVERYRKTTPALTSWAEENIPKGLTVLQLPPYHRTRMRTTNGLERLHRKSNDAPAWRRFSPMRPHACGWSRLLSWRLMKNGKQIESI